MMSFASQASLYDIAPPLEQPVEYILFASICVEAFHLAGDNASARSMRDLYLPRFPSGVWLPWVERWSGLE